jgi:type IV pilus assembly protein PilE
MKKGFTLIELLVVVLIIGILSAVALPQYEKAVWNTRARLLQTMVKSLAEAQERFFLANGTYTTNIEDLDISFDSLEKVTNYSAGRHLLYPLRPEGESSVYGNDWFQIGLLSAEGHGIYYTGGWFIKGKYKRPSGYYGVGFAYPHADYRLSLSKKMMYCSEGGDMRSYGLSKGDFCAKLLKATHLVAFSGNEFYQL